MAENNQKDVIELSKIIRKIIERRKLMLKVLGITFVLSSAYILCIPRTYSTECMLAPEMGGSMGGGTLGSIASSFGIDLSDMETSDAITPLLYPDLMDDNRFVVGLFNVKVVNFDGDLETTYFDYLKNHQSKPFWSYPMAWVKRWLSPKPKEYHGATGGERNPYILSKTEFEVAEVISSNVKLSVDKKSGVITINTKDQDQLICKTIADSVSQHLQEFITEYRTNKARNDVEFYEIISEKAHKEYDEARMAYSRFVDANRNTILQSYRSQEEDLENDVQLKYNAYSAAMVQLQQAVIKVQERTPAFTILNGATMPIKPSGPKRMIFVVAMLLVAFIVTTVYISRDELHLSF